MSKMTNQAEKLINDYLWSLENMTYFVPETITITDHVIPFGKLNVNLSGTFYRDETDAFFCGDYTITDNDSNELIKKTYHYDIE